MLNEVILNNMIEYLTIDHTKNPKELNEIIESTYTEIRKMKEVFNNLGEADKIIAEMSHEELMSFIFEGGADFAMAIQDCYSKFMLTVYSQKKLLERTTK